MGPTAATTATAKIVGPGTKADTHTAPNTAARTIAVLTPASVVHQPDRRTAASSAPNMVTAPKAVMRANSAAPLARATGHADPCAAVKSIG